MSELETNPGGEEEGKGLVLVLRPSELAVMRRMADKYPIVPGERKEVVDAVMTTLRASASKPRALIACAKVMLAMDQVNHQELRTYLEFTKNKEEPQQIVINNENKVTISLGDKDKFLARANEYNSAITSLPEINTDGRDGQPMDSPPAAPSTNGIHAQRGA